LGEFIVDRKESDRPARNGTWRRAGRKGRKDTRVLTWLKSAPGSLKGGRSAFFVLLIVLVLGLAAVDSSARRNLISSGFKQSISQATRIFKPQNESTALSQSVLENASSSSTKSRLESLPAIDAWHYFHPRWQNHPVASQQIGEDFRVSYQELFVTEEKLLSIVQDPDARLEKEFQVPFQLRDRVLFWMNVYTRLSKHTRLVHDRDNPSIIYGTIDYTPLYAQISNKMRAELNRRNIEKKILADLKARIEEAAGLTKTELLTPWEKSELRTFLSKAGAMNKERVTKLLSRIRTQSGQRHEFLEALNRSEKLLPYIEAVMKSYSLPAAIARLPFVESSFNNRAASKVGAVGIWQFMPATARQMIHPTDTKLWSEPLTQSRAAARLVIIFRSLLPDWSTTLTAYNSGVGRLQRLVRTYHARDIVKIIESNDRTLGFAGKNFYAQFLTANLIEAYKEQLFVELSDDEQAVQLAFRPLKSFNERFREVY
jgi:hypothetical protein